jgi:hypothetical protein
MDNDTPKFWGTTAEESPGRTTLTMQHLREVMDAMKALPPPLVLMPAPVPRGTMYVEKTAGCFLPLKYRAQVVLGHPDDVVVVQARLAEAGLGQVPVASPDDLKPWTPPAPKDYAMQTPDDSQHPAFFYWPPS